MRGVLTTRDCPRNPVFLSALVLMELAVAAVVTAFSPLRLGGPTFGGGDREVVGDLGLDPGRLGSLGGMLAACSTKLETAPVD